LSRTKKKLEIEQAGKAVAKLKLKRQEEITSSLAGSTGPIDIPKKASLKEPAGSFSDVEPEEDEQVNEDLAFDDNGRKYSEGSRSRNPVRRVNSSPEMSSSWRSPFVQTKGSSKSESNSKQWNDNVIATVVTKTPHSSDVEENISNEVISEQQQKKKSKY